MKKISVLWFMLVAKLFTIEAQATGVACQDLYKLSNLDHAVEPGVILAASQSAPEHCQVRGVIDGRIGFEVSMPLQGWNGRMMFLAHGGNAGRIGNTKDLLGKGFAQATTDSGHLGTDNIEFIRDRRDLINFGFRANHLTTVLSKDIISQFYGREVEYAYLQGCSGGGRSALMEALRFPDDYDGIIAGAPTLGWIRSTLPWAYAVTRVQQENPLTPANLSLLAENSRLKCDELDGDRDGLISNPLACTLDVLDLEGLQCKTAQQQDCLSSGQIETARFIYEGLKDDAGQLAYNGISPGDEDQGDWMLWVTGLPPADPSSGPSKTGYEGMVDMMSQFYHDDPSFNLEEFDPIKDKPALARRAAPVELPTPDFSPFVQSNGKLIVYHGWQDAPLRARDTLDFMKHAAELTGGVDVMNEFSRTYMIPNMLHCGGGSGPWAVDYITPMVDWVEKGIAPAGLVGTHPGMSNWLDVMTIVAGAGVAWYDVIMDASIARDASEKSTRLVCPYPQSPQYTGDGKVDVAASYRCESD